MSSLNSPKFIINYYNIYIYPQIYHKVIYNKLTVNIFPSFNWKKSINTWAGIFWGFPDKPIFSDFKPGSVADFKMAAVQIKKKKGTVTLFYILLYDGL